MPAMSRYRSRLRDWNSHFWTATAVFLAIFLVLVWAGVAVGAFVAMLVVVPCNAAAVWTDRMLARRSR